MPIDSTSVAPRSPVVSSRISNKSTKPLPGVDGRPGWNGLRLSVLGCALLAGTQTAAAQSFPNRPLTLVVPFAAGGPSDVAGRIFAQGLSEKLGQQVVVENPAGAGGTLGSLRVTKAPPDGYQFVIGNSGTHAWSQAL